MRPHVVGTGELPYLGGLTCEPAGQDSPVKVKSRTGLLIHGDLKI